MSQEHIAKYRDPSQPGKWYLTDFTMEQVEGQLASLKEQVAAAFQASPEDLRALGWMVAVHNDYRVDGKSCTFWLLTHSSGRWLKGEGVSDALALEQIRAVLRKEDDARKPSKGCNMHEDCKAAEAKAALEGKPPRYGSDSVRLEHCSDEGCEDCFGQ